MIEYVSVPMKEQSLDIYPQNIDSLNSSRLGIG